MSDGLEASRRRARRNVVLTAAIAGLGGLVPETKGKRLEDIQAIFQARVDKRRASA